MARAASKLALLGATALGGIGYTKWSENEKRTRLAAMVNPAPETPSFALAPGAKLPTTLVQGGHYDVAIVGGGIVGIATAREIVNRYPKKTVVVLEKESDIAQHQSGHNSGVIHAGIYYKPGSVMAEACVQGAEKMYAYCKAKNIPHERIGKLICATTEQEVDVLHTLLERGRTNGVKGLEILNAAQVKALEPNVEVVAALHSPNTGIVDFAVVTQHLRADFEATKRGTVLTNFLVEGFFEKEDHKSVTVCVVGREPGQKGPTKAITANQVITCAGLHSDRVAQLTGGATDPKILAFRGSYYQMKPEFRNIVKRNIYPVPSGGGIPVGVHFTPTVNDARGKQMIIGPGACLAFNREGYSFFDVSPKELLHILTHEGFWRFAMSNWNMAMTEMRRDLDKKAFLAEAQKMVPSMTEEMTEESFCGVMAQVLLPTGLPASDYIFERRQLGGRAMHVRNAPTPACTSSLAIAEKIVQIADTDFGWSVSPPSKAK